MRIKIGDFVLIKFPIFGSGAGFDIGPFLVKVVEITSDGICFRHFQDAEHGHSTVTGTCIRSDILFKLHDNDLSIVKDKFR